MKEIRANAKNLRALLGGAKFAIDYYQREYSWTSKQIEELIRDLVEKFYESYEWGHKRTDVKKYGYYFLGSIIISIKEEQEVQTFIVDGQQRLTTLTLILIYIYKLLKDSEDKPNIEDLIFSQQYGERSFNINVEERKSCMEALFHGKSFDETDQPESVVNILARFQDIEDNFPDDLTGDPLPYFADWLIENVYLVEITAYSDTDAYTIFETMNDRGLSLTPTDMLKGYILANIEEADHRNNTNQQWRKQVTTLRDIGKDEDADAIKAWLRSQYAETIRETKRDAPPRDFDLIGTEFHRWVSDHKEELHLSSSTDFAHFIAEDFAFYGRWYAKLREATKTITEDNLQAIHYCAQNNYTLQYPVLLAALQKEDSKPDILRKLRIVSAYLDILITRRIWNGRAITHSTMKHAMFTLMKEIRSKDISTLRDILIQRLDAENETFATNDRFRLHGSNRYKIHLILARLTDYIESSSGRSSRYLEYIQRGGKGGYEIEHIWADHHERHADEFEHAADFAEYRNRIGCLLLLPKSFNASYGDLPYNEKRPHYLKQNLLAQSFHEDAYERDPGFKRFIGSKTLRFEPHPQFKKDDIDARQELYRCLAEEIWNPQRIAREAE